MTIIQDLTTIITGTGITGGTIINGDGTIFGFSNLTMIGILTIIIIVHLLDRRLNRKEDKYQDQERLRELYQNPEKIEQELE